jgi:hypothetical protein
MRLVALALLATLVLAASANASAADVIPPVDAVATEGTGEVPPAGTVVEEVVQAATPPVAQESPEAVPVPPVVEAVPVPPVVEQVTEAVPTPPVVEAVPVPPVVEQVTEAVPVPPVVEEIPEAASAGPPPPEVAPVVPVVEEPPRGGVEEGSEASLSGGRSEESPKGSTGPPAPTALSGSEPMSEAASALAVSSTVPAVGDPGETWAIPGAGTRSSPPPATGAAQPAAAARPSCQLSVLNGPLTNCTTGWLGTQGLAQPGPLRLSSTAVSWSIRGTLAPAGSGHDDSVGATRPATPTPGPAPGGASGSSAVGGSGLALSAFLTLTGLLLLAAPRAMRRLRLSCEPWLTAFFVLIPERPG